MRLVPPRQMCISMIRAKSGEYFCYVWEQGADVSPLLASLVRAILNPEPKMCVRDAMKAAKSIYDTCRLYP
jgi:hypothetical protein